MLEQLKYKNHLNEVFEFGKNGIYVSLNELHDYEWTVTNKNKRITSLDYAVAKRKLPVIIICQTEEEGIAARNKLMEVCEKDVLAMKHGQIIIGDYYFKCFVTKSQKKNYLLSKRMMEVTLTLTSDFPYWVKETTNMFRELGAGGGGFLLFYVEKDKQASVRNALDKLLYVPFEFENHGTRILHYTPEMYEPANN